MEVDRALLLSMIERCEGLSAEYEVMYAEWDKVPWWRMRRWWSYYRRCRANLDQRQQILQALREGTPADG